MCKTKYRWLNKYGKSVIKKLKLIQEQLDGKFVDWMEKVSDEQYQQEIGKDNN